MKFGRLAFNSNTEIKGEFESEVLFIDLTNKIKC